MRLKPPVSNDEAYRYLSLNAALVWGVEDAAKMDEHLHSIARSMSVVGALEVPESIEPLFGEDIGLDSEPGA